MKDILWYLEDILNEFPKGTIVTTNLLVETLRKANNLQDADIQELEDSIDWEH